MDHCYLDGYAREPVGINSLMEPGHFFFSIRISPIHSIVLTSNREFSYLDGYIWEPVGRRFIKGYMVPLLFDNNSWNLLFRRLRKGASW